MIYVTALISGLLASFHCFLMCGGIALASPNAITTNVIRIMTYALLGALFSLLIDSLPIKLDEVPHAPRGLLGIGLLSLALLSIFQKKNRCGQHCAIKNTQKLYWLWGALPCPMVMAMLVASLSLDTPMHSALFMLAFGVGTLPALLTFKLCTQRVTRHFKKLQPSLATSLMIGSVWCFGSDLLPHSVMSHDHHHSSHSQHSHHSHNTSPSHHHKSHVMDNH